MLSLHAKVMMNIIKRKYAPIPIYNLENPTIGLSSGKSDPIVATGVANTISKDITKTNNPSLFLWFLK
ncbi:hypothetical protein VEE27_32660 [Escherichia coli]|nr:hypothetical protein VEE27_32660 [Escherichia coli]